MARKTTRKPVKPVEVYSKEYQSYAPCCPVCGTPITLQATVEAMDVPAGWHFFGRQGERWIKCRGFSGVTEFIHFVTLLNGRYSHRLAWLNEADKTPVAEQRMLL